MSAHYHYGSVLAEYSSFTYLTEDFVQSVDLYFEKETVGKNPWEEVFGYPTYGIGLFYTTLGNDEIHGRELAVFPYMKFRILGKEKLNLSGLMGLGLGYVTKSYDPERNPFNVVIGSKFNIHFQASLLVRYQLINSVSLDAGLGFAHFSNGNTAEPNIGINNATMTAGIAYRLSEKSPQIKNEFLPMKKSWFWEAGVTLGSKSTRSLQQSRHMVFAATADVWKPLTRVVSVGIGPDVFYDTAAETELLGRPNEQYQSSDQLSSGIHASVAFRYGKFRLIIQTGAYLLKENAVIDDFIYNRAMMRFDASKRIFVHFAMKSHLHILDYPELGIGYRWQNEN
ncbi:MAG: acyloxyacyl hydrolase [Cryomorphaceae bacterium]|nr:acyloxyacyl hydrolase [Flavobacteriales bacterium]